MNSIVFIILAAAMIAVAFYLVALPLLQHARRDSTSTPESITEQERLEELLAQRDAAFQALRELNFDHQVGKITDEDYIAFEGNLKRHAANTLRALDEWEAEADDDLDLEMEAAIQARRQVYAAPATVLSAPAAPCPNCGKPTSAADRFCSACGADLTVARTPAAPAASPGLTCSKCGNNFEPGDRFCGTCGQPLAQPAESVV
jgi:hypothetical protein